MSHIFNISQVDIEAYFRKSSTDEFARILRWDKVDICKFAANVDSYSVFKEHLKSVNRTFGGIIHPCPYKGALIIDKISLSLNYLNPAKTSLFPNGESKIAVHAYNNKNPDLMYYQLTFKQLVF